MQPSQVVDAQRLISLLTHERMESYLRECSQDPSGALALYDWNTSAAGSVLGVLGMAEVIVRNALDAQLQSHGRQQGWTDWLDEAPLDQRGREDVRNAKKRLSRRPVCTRGMVIAELSFGFWRFLCASRYFTSMWVPAMHNAFPCGDANVRTRQQQVEGAMRELVIVRNRAAHHEPLHRRDLLVDLATAADLVGWVDPAAKTWLMQNEGITGVVRARKKLNLER